MKHDVVIRSNLEIMAVTFERTDKELIIKLPLGINPVDIQNALEYFQFVDIVSRSKATEKDIDELAKEVKSNWSEEMKAKLAEMEEFKGVFE
jgi:hypothetical protein